MSTPVGVGHNHLDAGTFQLWRKGRFVTRETVGYAQLIAGYADSAPRDCRDTVGHNGLLYDGRGSIDWRPGRKRSVHRLEWERFDELMQIHVPPGSAT